jgi:hypothetical protein
VASFQPQNHYGKKKACISASAVSQSLSSLGDVSVADLALDASLAHSHKQHCDDWGFTNQFIGSRYYRAGQKNGR